MKAKITSFIISVACILIIFLFVFHNDSKNKTVETRIKRELLKPIHQLPASKTRIRSSFSPKNRNEAIGRMNWEQNRLKNPKSGKIPTNIRKKELEFARNIQTRVQYSFEKTAVKPAREMYSNDWKFRGPKNIGGRTRALAVDLNYNGTTNRRILAGGISGGVYLSEDGGQSWRLTTALADLASVTCITQDPHRRNIWYYGTGEYISNSAAGGGNWALWGNGLFKSIDGGETWTQLASTSNENIATFDNFWDIVWNVAVHPTNSSVFAAAFGIIYRSQSGGNFWKEVLGKPENNKYNIITDIAIAADGSIYATLSRNGSNLAEYGVFCSTDNGDNWQNISPMALSADPYRMVLASAPSDPNIVYLLVQANYSGTSAAEHQFFKYNARTGTWEDLSANLPTKEQFPDDWQRGDGEFQTQMGYDQVVKVKPDDPDVVWIGGTNLYRSVDGGYSFTWVGGYHPSSTNVQLYPNHYPDQHAIVFFPGKPNMMLSGHDGGISMTKNNLETPQAWVSLNNGYITTQFYAIAIAPVAGSEWLVGGMQDRSTWITYEDEPNQPWDEIGSGDGGFCAIVSGQDHLFYSSQKGHIYRYTLTDQWYWSRVSPAGIDEENFLFITPYQLDPNAPERMYLAGGHQLWYNSNLEKIPFDNKEATDINWSPLTNSAIEGTWVTALSICRQPADRLYFGVTDFNTLTVIKKLDHSSSNPTGIDITPSGIDHGSYPSCLGINPGNGDELLLTFSNYQVPSVFYTDDGGNTWQDVEGNLSGKNGPSVRWAAIMPTANGNIYFLATSTGIYSSTCLSGNTTEWMPEAEKTIGNVVVDMLATRPTDGLIAAGTHGRGAYSAKIAVGSGTAIAQVEPGKLTIEAKKDAVAKTQFTIRNIGTANLNFQITTDGTEKRNSINSAQLPRVHPVDHKKRLFPVMNNIPSVAQNGFTLDKFNPVSNSESFQGNDTLCLDDGNTGPDKYMGFQDGQVIYWLNQFELTDFDFRLEKISFYYRTETADVDSFWAALYDQSGNTLVQGQLPCLLAQDGAWYEIILATPIQFKSGQSFSFAAGGFNGVAYPAGFDYNGKITDKSFYWDQKLQSWVNLNTVKEYAYAAFLIRAVGTKSGSEGQARLAVSPSAGTISPCNSQTISVMFNTKDLAFGKYSAQIFITSNGGDFKIPVEVAVLSAVDGIETILPGEITLHQNYPNPFNPTTSIRYELPKNAQINLQIFNLLGEEIIELVDAPQPAGKHEVVWNGRDAYDQPVASGIYSYILTSGEFKKARQMLIIK